MNSELLEKVKNAQRLYYLANKYKSVLPKAYVLSAKKICNTYTKMAKEKEESLSKEELFKYILK